MSITKTATLYGTYHLLHQQAAKLLVSKVQCAAGGILDGSLCHLAIKHMGAKARYSTDGNWLYNEAKTVVSAPATIGLLRHLYGKLRRGLTKVHQLAVAAEVTLEEGAQVA